jgi:general secretion pathway protein G
MRKILLSFGLFVASFNFALMSMPYIDRHGYWKYQTITDISMTTKVVELFATENGRIPTQNEGLNALLEKPKDDVLHWNGPYIDDMPRDYWGTPYIYKVLDLKNKKFVIYSAGPNRKDDEQGFDDVIWAEKKYQCELYADCKTTKDYIYILARALTIITFLAFVWQLLYFLFLKIKTLRGTQA